MENTTENYTGNETYEGGSKFKSFLSSQAGYYVMVAVFAIIIWGLIILLAPSGIGAVIAVVCAFFGWKALNRIQPSMFLWLTWVGWLIYFFIKLALSIAIGMFVAPFRIGKWVAGIVSDSL